MAMWIQSVAGVTYALQYTTNLIGLPPNWVQVDAEAGTGESIMLADPDAGDVQRTYRVVKP